MAGFDYNDPNFLIIREAIPTPGVNGSVSCPSVGTAYVGSTLKVYHKAVVLGVHFEIQSGAGSAVGTNSISIARIGTAGTSSAWNTYTLVTSLGASMAGDEIDITCGSAMTLSSAGEHAAILCNAASVHKCVVIKNIVWRYRLLPQEIAGSKITWG